MKKLLFIIVMLTTIGITALLSGCEQEGPAEKAGAKIDNAVEDTKENIQEAGETVQEKLDPDGPAENIGEEIDEAAEKAKEEAIRTKKEVEEAVKY